MLPTKQPQTGWHYKRSPDPVGLVVFLLRYMLRQYTHKFIMGFLLFIAFAATLLGFRNPMEGAKRASLLVIQSPRTPRPVAGDSAIDFPVPAEEAAPTTKIRKGDKVTPEEYIKRYAKYAVIERKKYKIPASITLAQGIIESRSGNSKLAQVANNHFGIKCFSKRHSACCVKSKDDSNNDSFVLFDSPLDAYEAHSQCLRKDRYKKLYSYGSNYRQWAYGLKSCGYATDKTYAEKLIGIIERYDLHKYDR